MRVVVCFSVCVCLTCFSLCHPVYEKDVNGRALFGVLDNDLCVNACIILSNTRLAQRASLGRHLMLSWPGRSFHVQHIQIISSVSPRPEPHRLVQYQIKKTGVLALQTGRSARMVPNSPIKTPAIGFRLDILPKCVAVVVNH